MLSYQHPNFMDNETKFTMIIEKLSYLNKETCKVQIYFFHAKLLYCKVKFKYAYLRKQRCRLRIQFNTFLYIIFMLDG